MSVDFSNATARPWELDAVLKIDGVKTQATIYPSFGDDIEKTYEAPSICTLAYDDAAIIVHWSKCFDDLIAALVAIKDCEIPDVPDADFQRRARQDLQEIAHAAIVKALGETP